MKKYEVQTESPDTNAEYLRVSIKIRFFPGLMQALFKWLKAEALLVKPQPPAISDRSKPAQQPLKKNSYSTSFLITAPSHI